MWTLFLCGVGGALFYLPQDLISLLRGFTWSCNRKGSSLDGYLVLMELREASGTSWKMHSGHCGRLVSKKQRDAHPGKGLGTTATEEGLILPPCSQLAAPDSEIL